jgi:hypothetical protein
LDANIDPDLAGNADELIHHASQVHTPKITPLSARMSSQRGAAD